jgi:hypothetical protein
MDLGASGDHPPRKKFAPKDPIWIGATTKADLPDVHARIFADKGKSGLLLARVQIDTGRDLLPSLPRSASPKAEALLPEVWLRSQKSGGVA